MILLWLIIIPLAGGLAAWLLERKDANAARWISLSALVSDALLLLSLLSGPAVPASLDRGAWLAELSIPWVPRLGIGIHLAADGLSLVLIALTLFLGIIAVVCSWNEIRERVGFFHMNLLWVLAGILGVFTALDLFLFYFFWELMLIPMYFLISLWGHENRGPASLKFFIFTQAGGLLMLLSILALYYIHGRDTGIYTFDYPQLLGTSMSPNTAFWIMLGFVVAFLVKLPALPFHPWLPDAHTEAPTAGSVVLAGLLLKTGAYGLIRFALPLFPDASAAISQAMLVLAVCGIIYGAILAFGQTDLKRLVAYTSVSHMGFVLLGIYAGGRIALAGAVMQMIAHGISTGALFLLVGIVQERMHTRELGRMGGLWSLAPRLSGIGLVFSLASLGLPGFGNFVAEFMVLAGSFRDHAIATVCAASGLVLAAIYSLRIVQKAFFGEHTQGLKIDDLDKRETGMLAVLIGAILWIGVFPGPVQHTIEPALSSLEGHSRRFNRESGFQTTDRYTRSPITSIGDDGINIPGGGK